MVNIIDQETEQLYDHCLIATWLNVSLTDWMTEPIDRPNWLI